MRDEIISELRRIRDMRAQRYEHDIEAMARDLMKLDPWMEKKTVAMRHGRMVPAVQRRGKPSQRTSGTTQPAKHR